MKIRLSLLFFVVFTFFFACDSNLAKPKSSADGAAFLPFTVNSYIIYKVDEKQYSIIKGNIVKTYYLKELISDSSINNNEVTYTFQRSKSNTIVGIYKIDSVWYGWKNSFNVVKVENNRPIVKLPRQLLRNGQWNGNLYNSLGNQTLTLQSIGESRTYNSVVYENTLSVLHLADSSDVHRDYHYEIYGKGVGLLQMKKVATTNQQESGVIKFPLTIDKGFDITQTIVVYGKN